MDLISASRTGGAPADTLVGVTDLQVIASGSATWLVALGRVPATLMSFSVGGMGLSYVHQTVIPGSLSPLPAELSMVPLGGAPRLMVSGMTGPAYSWGWNEGFFDSAQPVTALPQAPGRVVGLELSGGRYLWGSEIDQPGLGTWRSDTSGLVRTAVVADTPTSYLDDVTQLSVTRTASGNFLLAAGGDNGLSAFRIDPAGGLALTGSVGALDGIGIDRPQALVEAGETGAGRFVLAAQGSSSLTVVRILADGKPVATDHVIDSLDTRFADVTALASVTTAGHTLVVAGGSDGGISLFELLPNDRLLHLRVLLDSGDTSLDGVSALAATVIGDRLNIFAGSGREQGLSRLEFGLTELGPVVRGTPRGDALAGTALDDVLWGGDGPDRLSSGAGHDTLIDGPGRDTLTGGLGADVFIITRDLATDLITDFDPLHDRIDLSSFRGIYTPGQVKITGTATGADILVQGELLSVRSTTGGPLDPALFTAAMLFDLPRSVQPILTGLVIEGNALAEALTGSTAGDIISGYNGNDTLSGGQGTDTLRGGLGNDLLTGDQDNDNLLGGPGHDQLQGGAGHDVLWGNDGDDTLWGDADALAAAGNDMLYGGAGNDLMFGFAGADRLLGGTGHDTMGAGAGNDLVHGEDGDDLLLGEDGDDSITGGTGQDTLWGGPGNDTLGGDLGDDLILGEDGDDRVYAGAGRDIVSGQAGNDTLWGGLDDDVVEGGIGHDLLLGEFGNDTLWGGAGADQLRGGAGDDVLRGEVGNDLLVGEDGADWLLGDGGNDILRGGAGADIFVFAPGSGMDVIADFSVVTPDEIIDLTAFVAFSSLADLAPWISHVGADTVIALDPTTSLRLAGLAPEALGADDFLFNA